MKTTRKMAWPLVIIKRLCILINHFQIANHGGMWSIFNNFPQIEEEGIEKNAFSRFVVVFQSIHDQIDLLTLILICGSWNNFESNHYQHEYCQN